ncbi:MAG: DMT family transporter [Actinomycetota bacterium]|nr:DMT family transporter [Actinomycetota bacterium]PLS85990.1 MAG: hypothetical protein CYG60_09635 [Actinomycetota bacterium]
MSNDGRRTKGNLMGWFLLTAVVIIVALLLDHVGLAGRERRPITLGRIVGVALILLGVALFLGLH